MDSTNKLSQLLNEFSKFSRYKINIEKSVVFLYTNSDLSEKESKKMIPLVIALKRIKYQRIHLTKEMKDLHSGNHKILTKEIKITQISGKMYHAHELEELILLKCPYYPNNLQI